MKTQVVLLILGISFVIADENSKPDPFPPMADPRPPIYRTFSMGKKSQQTLSEAIVVIAWLLPPKGSDKTGYQIWGDERILSMKQLSASLQSLCKATESWSEQPHLLVIGNNWNVGRELDPLMKALSKIHEIDTYYYGASYLFREVAFKKEEGRRKKKIVAAVDAGIKSSEQGDSVQPATNVDSRAKGGEKPEPESGGRRQ